MFRLQSLGSLATETDTFIRAGWPGPLGHEFPPGRAEVSRPRARRVVLWLRLAIKTDLGSRIVRAWAIAPAASQTPDVRSRFRNQRPVRLSGSPSCWNDGGVKLGILCGGGPAPGMNSVISAATIEARNSRWGRPRDHGRLRAPHRRPDRGGAAPCHHGRVGIDVQGGSILRTSRANPTVRDEGAADPDWRLHACLESLQKLGIDALVTIGGTTPRSRRPGWPRRPAGACAWRTCRRPSTTTCRYRAAYQRSASRRQGAWASSSSTT